MIMARGTDQLLLPVNPFFIALSLLLAFAFNLLPLGRQPAVPDMLALPSLRCLDFGQSHLNDVDAVYPQARARQIGLLRVRATREELTGGSIRRRFPAGATLLFEAGSLAEAQAAVAAYRQGA